MIVTLRQAVNMLEKQHEKAQNLDFVRNPLAYALYQVWKEADKLPQKEQRG